ncbi:MAG: hypothetical protein RI560_07955 [Natronomonas sp.]|nr:hypothetical protein [Natronomonas sp.]MDR9381589.1 hypothetical protein [Natronomonas sp.]MDR9431358.1 hypothetical protein [Natronomonas sp.]
MSGDQNDEFLPGFDSSIEELPESVERDLSREIYSVDHVYP